MASPMRLDGLTKTFTLLSLLSTLISPSCAIPASRRDEKQTSESFIELKGINVSDDSVPSWYSVATTINDQPFDLLLDTGHGRTWIAHERCSACRDAGMKTTDMYLPDGCSGKSALTYNYGSFESQLEQDVKGCIIKVSLGLGDYKLDDYGIFVVTEMDAYVYGLLPKSKHSGHLGIAGLVSQDATSQDQIPVLRSMVDQGLLQSKEVGLYLPAKSDTTGKLILGGPSQVEEVNQSKVASVPNIAKNMDHFDIQVDSIAINGIIAFKNITARLDSSTSGVLFPYELNQQVRGKLYSEYSSISYSPVSCATDSSVTFIINGQEFPIGPEELVSKTQAQGARKGECQAQFRAHDEKTDAWIFGTGFLHRVYPSFDLEKGDIKLFGLKS